MDKREFIKVWLNFLRLALQEFCNVVFPGPGNSFRKIVFKPLKRFHSKSFFISRNSGIDFRRAYEETLFLRSGDHASELSVIGPVGKHVLHPLLYYLFLSPVTLLPLATAKLVFYSFQLLLFPLAVVLMVASVEGKVEWFGIRLWIAFSPVCGPCRVGAGRVENPLSRIGTWPRRN